jgi:hypothetical protein
LIIARKPVEKTRKSNAMRPEHAPDGRFAAKGKSNENQENQTPGARAASEKRQLAWLLGPNRGYTEIKENQRHGSRRLMSLKQHPQG